jgi:ribosome assembly protein YihI (activator of Der GTPase)
LRSKGGWSPTQTVIEVEQDSADEDLSAIDALAEMLGITEDEADSTDT